MKRIIVPQLFGRTHLLNSSLGLVSVIAGAPIAHAADVRPVTNPVGQNSHISAGASHLSSGQLRLGLEGNAARRVSLKQKKSGEDKVFLSETGAANVGLSYGISDNLSLHLSTEMTRHIQKKTDPEVVSNESRQLKSSGSTLATQYVFTDRDGWFHSGVSLYATTGAGKDGKMSYVRDEKARYGIILGNSFGDIDGSRIDLDLGAQFKDAKKDEMFSETRRLHASLTGYVVLLDSLSLFTGLSGEEIAAEPKTKIYSASYHYGVDWKVAGLDVSAYGVYGVKSASFGTARQEGGLAISYTFGESKKAAAVVSLDDEESAPVEKKAKAVKGKKVKTEEAEEEISIEKVVNSLPKGQTPDEMDEFELQEQRQKEEEKKYGNGLTEWEKIEQELDQIKATEKLQKEAEERRQKEQERVNRANSIKNAKEEERRLKVLQEEVSDEVNRLEGVSDDELNWKGLE